MAHKIKTLTTYNPININSEFFSEDFAIIMAEDFFNPLSEMGFKCTNNITLSSKKQQRGQHIFWFNHDSDYGYRESWLEQFITQEEGMSSNYLINGDQLTLIIDFTH